MGGSDTKWVDLISDELYKMDALHAAKNSSKSLLSMIQTCSLEIVLAPIAQHVSDLLHLSSSGHSIPYPELMPSALAVMESVQDMASIAQKIAQQSMDEELKTKMPVVSDMALKMAEKLLEAAGRLSENPLSQHTKKMLNSITQSILEWTVKLLVVWDEGEVRKIVNAAQWALDRLGLVQGAKSMRSLVICFGGLSEAMLLLLSLADKRQKELTDADSKHRLLNALDQLKTNLPKFTQAMQTFVKSPSAPSAKETKDSLSQELATALRMLIDAVYPFNREADNMAGNILEVQRKLMTDRRYYIGPDLDRHLDAVIQNSMAVAHVSRDQYRDAIQKLCGEVLSLRTDLQDLAEAISCDPDNETIKEAFDSTAEQLRTRLLELDRWVADSVVDQVTEVFVEPSDPLKQLVHAATSPGAPYLTPGSKSTTTATPTSTVSLQSSPSSGRHDDSMEGLSRQVELFRRHSKRLSQVAAYAAQSATNAKRVQTIKVLASNVDKLTPQVVEAVLNLRRDPTNQTTQEQLDSVRREWAEKVQELTSAIDDIIDPEDFMAVSEANIQQDMARCRDAISMGNWQELARIVQSIAAKAKRISEFGHSTVKQATDHTFKTTLAQAISRLDKAVPLMLKQCQRLTSNPTQHLQDQFVSTLRELLEAIHDIQSVLSHEIDVPHTEEDGFSTEEVDYSSLSPSKQSSAQERMLRRNIERHRQQPRYIGSLRSAADKGEGPQSASPQIGSVSGRPESSLSFTSSHTLSHQTKDHSLQVDLTDSLGTVSPEASTASWTTPSQPSPHKYTPRSSTEAVGLYVSPLNRLVDAAEKGDTEGIPLHASQLSARTIRLTNIAESAAETLKPDTELARTLKSRSSKVSRLVPQVIDKAEQVAHDPQAMDELHTSTQQWAGHVQQLVDGTQQASLPWSRTAGRLVAAVRTGKDVRKQITHVSTQTDRILSIATTTIEAANTEEAIESTNDSAQSYDHELRRQVEHVRVAMSEVRKLTPQLLNTAERAAGGNTGSATMEHLTLLSQEWATKAKVLLKGVDDVSLGMGGAADTLMLAAQSGDPSLLAEQSQSIQGLANSLQEIAGDAAEGCDDSDKVQVVQVTASNIKKLSTQLVSVAESLAGGKGGAKEQVWQEDSEILRRDWSSQVHLLTAHVDELTTEVSAPLDRLVDTALQASRTDGLAKGVLIKQFEQRASFISKQLGVMIDQFQVAADSTKVRPRRLEKIGSALSFLTKLTPHAIGAARSLASDPGPAMLDHFNHLRRQWASKAQYLLANLRRIITPDLSKVLDAFLELLHTTRMTADIGVGTPLGHSLSDETFNEEKVPDVPKGSPPRPTLSPECEAAGQKVFTPHRTKRPTSMVVPLPTWSTQAEADPYIGASYSIAVAAASLWEVTDEFLEQGNPIVQIAKKMSTQMSQMAEYSRGRGELQNQSEMIDTAKAIAANGQTIVRFAAIIGEHCTDKTIRNELQYCTEMIPTLSTQLKIISTVKAATPNDSSADMMLVKNAQNLMKAVIKTVEAAEAACMKGLRAPEDEGEEEEQIEATSLAAGWKKKLYRQRTLETLKAPRDARGMRKLNKNRISTPSVVDIIKPRKSLLASPPHRL